MSLKNFFEFNLQSLKQFLSTDLKIEEKKTSMRAKQLWQAVYKKGLEELSYLTTLPVELRNELISKITLEKPKITDKQIS
jgi:adenine C2-methylase RlmN of 23S rRNA A2503 and tRNA A37